MCKFYLRVCVCVRCSVSPNVYLFSRVQYFFYFADVNIFQFQANSDTWIEYSRAVTQPDHVIFGQFKAFPHSSHTMINNVEPQQHTESMFVCAFFPSFALFVISVIHALYQPSNGLCIYGFHYEFFSCFFFFFHHFLFRLVLFRQQAHLPYAAVLTKSFGMQIQYYLIYSIAIVIHAKFVLILELILYVAFLAIFVFFILFSVFFLCMYNL